MLRNLRVGWRQFVADPGYTAVIMLGLSAAIACCYLTAQVVLNEVLPDPDLPDPGRVVNFEFRGNDSDQDDNWFDQAPFVLATALRQRQAGVSAVARSLDGHEYVVHAGERSARLAFEFADRDLIDIFGLHASAGDLRAAFERPDAVALTDESARRLFPAGDAIGKTVVVQGKTLTVVALLPQRTHGDEQAQDAFVGFDSAINHVDEQTRTSWGSIQGKVFARLANGFRPEDIGAVAQALYDRGPGVKSGGAWSAAGADKEPVLRAMPLTRQYLEGGRGGRFRSRQLVGLGGAAALMLALALANYINLSSVRTLARAREIAVRKTLGASPWRLTAQFMAESALAAGLAAAIGLLLAWWLAPTIGQLMYLRLADDFFVPGRLALLAAAALALGAVTGLYPARIALSVHCGAALAGRSHDEGSIGRGLRRAMTTLQFAIALVVTAACGAMLWQNHHVAALPHGIRTTGLLAVDVPDGFTGRSDALNTAFREALSHEPGVEAMAWSMDVPGRGQAWSGIKVARAGGAAPIGISVLPVDVDFFDVFDVPLVAGALRTPPPPAPEPPASAPAGHGMERLIVVDSATSRALGFASPRDAVDQVVMDSDPGGTAERNAYRIVAVARDVRMEHAHEHARLHAFGLSRKPQETLTLRGPRMEPLRQAVARVWPRFFPEDEMAVSTVDEALAVPYRTEHWLARMTLATTAISLLLSAFGVYALAAYTVRRSAREIVVRKLYGAGRARIAGLVAREFAPLLAIATVVGLPLAGWLAHAWIENFTERSTAAFWALPIALAALVAMTALAAARHALIAMNMRPTLALRD